MVLPASHGISRVPWYSGSQPGAFKFRLRDYHPVSYSFPAIFDYLNCTSFTVSSTPDKSGLGSFPFARRYLGNRTFFLFLRVLRCFSSPGLPLITYFIGLWVLEGCSSGFPHSDISGSVSICDSPKHFGAYPVLHRLLVPRHSPYALNNLTFFFYFMFVLLDVVFNVQFEATFKVALAI